MANAAAKKAAQARAQAASTYFPIVMIVNAVYILLFLGVKGLEDLPSIKEAAGIIATWGLQYFAYGGILDNAANRNPNDKSLVGGSSLDLLGLTVLIQFGTVLWSPKSYWLLLVAPVWGGWTLYSTFRGDSSGASKGASAPSEPTETDKELAEKRQKRAERRRQKRA